MLKNLTPHPITLIWPDGSTETIAPDPDGPARVSEEPRVVVDSTSTPGGRHIDLYAPPVFGVVTGLPDPTWHDIFIVSLLVAQACDSRSDLAVVSETVRDPAGRIIGCRGLSLINMVYVVEPDRGSEGA